MKEKTRIRKILEVIGYVISCLVLAALLAVAVSVLVQTIQLETNSQARIELHSNLLLGAAGIVAFFVLLLIPRFRSNFRWLMKFTHEFTHLFFALLFFRKIHRFKVDSEESYVSYSNGWFGYFTITLSPYCIPLFTLALLPWRYTTGEASAAYLAIIDVLIGLTYAFHICCWLKQTRLHQTDIIGLGVIRSILIIATVHLLIFSLILLTPSSGVLNAIKRTFWEFPSSFVMSVIH